MIRLTDLAEILDQLSPMYVLLDKTGHIQQVGSTLQKLRPDQPMQGRRFLELFELNRPRAVITMADLVATNGAKLHLQLRDAPRTSLKGVLAPLPDGAGALVNLSLGISVLDAVRDYALTSADFSATDLTIELLYLVEAKSAAMEASRKLNLRLQGAMIAAEEQAFTDTLTGLKNRRAMDHILTRLVGARIPFAMMHLDLDFFKSVNDTLGHAAGDHVLQRVARILVEETRSEDTVARVGGDEFVLLFDRLLDRKRLGRIAARIIKKLEDPIPFGGQRCHISGSIGIVLSHQYVPPDATQMLQDADIALYAAKHAGRACHRFYSDDLADGPMTARASPAPVGKPADDPDGQNQRPQ